MEQDSEPAWAGEIRKALMEAVKMVREGHPTEAMPHILAAMDAGWPLPEDYRDFWGTARAIAGLDGSLKQFPVDAFLRREMTRSSEAA